MSLMLFAWYGARAVLRFNSTQIIFFLSAGTVFQKLDLTSNQLHAHVHIQLHLEIQLFHFEQYHTHGLGVDE